MLRGFLPHTHAQVLSARRKTTETGDDHALLLASSCVGSSVHISSLHATERTDDAAEEGPGFRAHPIFRAVCFDNTPVGGGVLLHVDDEKVVAALPGGCTQVCVRVDASSSVLIAMLLHVFSVVHPSR